MDVFKSMLGFDRLEAIFRSDTIKLKNDSIIGVLELHAKIDLEIQSIEFEIWEEYKRGWLTSKKKENFLLGRKMYEREIMLSKSEIKVLKFNIPIQDLKSPIEKRLGGSILSKPFLRTMKTIGNIESIYTIKSKLKVKGSALKTLSNIKLKWDEIPS